MVQMRLKKKYLLPLIYCIFTSIYYTLNGWKYASKIDDVILVIGIICGFFYVFENLGHQIKTFLILFPFVILILYRLSIGGDTRLIVSLLAIFIGMNVEFEEIAKWIFYSKLVAFIGACMLGGYYHRNYLGMNIGVLIFLMLIIYYKKYRVKSLLIACAMYIVGVLVSKSGAMIICVGFGLVLYLFINTRWERKALGSKIWIMLFPFIMFINWFLVCLYAAYGYSNYHFYFIKSFIPASLSKNMYMYINILNQVLSGRINLAAFSLEKFGVSLWGGNIDYSIDTGLPYFLVDSGMMLLLQDWGIVMMVMVMLLFIYLMWKLIKEKEYQLIISAIVVALWAFNEDTLLSVGTNYLFYIIGYKLYNRKQKNDFQIQ